MRPEQLQQGPFARLGSLTDDAAGVCDFFVLGAKGALLAFDALLGIQPGDGLHHGQHGVARLAIAGLGLVPHAVDLIAHSDRGLREVQEQRIRPAGEDLGNLGLHQGITDALLCQEQVGGVRAIVLTLGLEFDRRPFAAATRLGAILIPTTFNRSESQKRIWPGVKTVSSIVTLPLRCTHKP